jgi:hypothetical protein
MPKKQEIIDGLLTEAGLEPKGFGVTEATRSRHANVPFKEMWREAMAKFLASLSVEMKIDLEDHGYEVTKISQPEGMAGVWVYFEPDPKKEPPLGLDGPMPKGDVYVSVNYEGDISAGAHLRPGVASTRIREKVWNFTPNRLSMAVLGGMDDRLGTYY